MSLTQTRNQLSKLAGVGTGTVARYKQVVKSGDQKLIDEVRTGKKTVNKAYTEVKKKIDHDRREEEGKIGADITNPKTRYVQMDKGRKSCNRSTNTDRKIKSSFALNGEKLNSHIKKDKSDVVIHNGSQNRSMIEIYQFVLLYSNEEFGSIRALDIDGVPWFIVRDVATTLGYKKPENAIRANVDEDDTLTEGIIDSMGRMQKRNEKR